MHCNVDIKINDQYEKGTMKSNTRKKERKKGGKRKKERKKAWITIGTLKRMSNSIRERNKQRKKRDKRLKVNYKRGKEIK